LSPRVFKISKVYNKCKNIRLKPFNQEVFAEKTLTYHHEIALQTLVVNLPSREMPKMPRNAFLQQVCLTQKEQIPK
jgi:hypothetical protein